MEPEGAGLENPSTIDLVSSDGEHLDLIIMQSVEWDGSDRLLGLLQAKIESYVSFALEGGREEAFPEQAGLPWRIVVACQSPPDDRTLAFVNDTGALLRRHGSDLLLRYLEIAVDDETDGPGEAGTGEA